MGLKHQELRDGCFAQAAEDEPLFVLKSTDELAPDIVREWARRYLLSKLDAESTGEGDGRLLLGYLPRTQYKKYEDARRLADQMDAWRTRHQR